MRPNFIRFESPKSIWFVRGVSVTFAGSSGTLTLVEIRFGLITAPTSQPLYVDLRAELLSVKLDGAAFETASDATSYIVTAWPSIGLNTVKDVKFGFCA